MFRVCDSHCHLQDKKFSKDLERVINSAKEKGVKSIIVPGWDVNSSKYAMEIAEKYEEIYATIGIHPDAYTRTHPFIFPSIIDDYIVF